MKNLTIGGVPEHFNYPWYLTLANKEYTPYDINLRWKDFPGGTGQMCTALRDKEIDIAIVLTEGIIKDIANGNPCKIVQCYVDSPLTWGIHTAYDAPFKTVADLEHATIAISRYGSGSHLMAIVNAYNQGWNITALKFKVVNDLEGGIKALQEKQADYFMWEHFTTKPFVDNQTFKRIGNCPTPWPCFVIAVRNEILEKHPEEVKAILETIRKKTMDFKSIPNINNTLAEHYQLKTEDINKWLSLTYWNTDTTQLKEVIIDTQTKMQLFNIIQDTVDPEFLIKTIL